jgi:CorA-like Mg2+ transporter protein
VEEKRSDNGALAFEAPQVLVEIDLHSGESRAIIDGAKPLDSQAGVARFIVAGADHIKDARRGRFDSTAELSIPSVDVDSETSYDLSLRFYIEGELVTVVITGGGPIPRHVLIKIASGLAFEMRRQSAGEMNNLGRDARWLVYRVLRGRVRAIEESVRRALVDEHISPEDYVALREYPERLARVERLVSTIKWPEWEATGSRDPYRISFDATPDRLYESLSEVGREAREAVARLSGLIASQSVVVAQRQAAETERFQRLLTLVGTTVLVPGLVAAVFGANVDLPGKNSLDGFYAMLCFHGRERRCVVRASPLNPAGALVQSRAIARCWPV